MTRHDSRNSPTQTVVFKVEGITCLDCAVKFEKNVAALPGVTNASLNTMIGKLTVEGLADLQAIRREGRKLTPVGEERLQPATSKLSWELVRAVASGLAILAAYAVKLAGGPGAFSIALFAVAMVAGGWGNARKAFYSLPRLDFNMSVLMAAAVVGAAAIGEWGEGAVVAFLYSVSEMLESWTMQRARRSIRQLIDIAPKVAIVRRPEGDVRLPVDEIQVGDVMVVRPGEKIAMDGRIVAGESAINEAAITGESIPAEKGRGDEVFAGTLNSHGVLEVEVTKRAQDTTIAKIIHMVEDAQAKRAPSQAFVERFAAVYTPAVLALAAGIVFLPPLVLGYEWHPWIYRGLALLVVSCPCALVVSTPVSIVSAIGNAARNGVLIKGGVYLEEMGSLKAVAFDKTGTLTKGTPSVTDVVALDPGSERELLEIAASLEARSEHPLAVAIVKAAQARNLKVEPAADFKALPGRGAQGRVNGGRLTYIGNLRLFKEIAVSPDGIEEGVRHLQDEGKTVMIVGTSQAFLGVIAVADELRGSSAAAVAALKRAGVARTIMLTGDNMATAQAIARRAGVDEYRAELLPQDKVASVKSLLEQYGKVAMVGDGINDAPALATATVGIAMGGAGSDTALETADVALMADDLTRLPFTVSLSRAALSVIRQNIGFSLAIKAIAVAAVFPGWLTLWLAILADMGATVLVTLNGMRLLGLKPER